MIKPVIGFAAECRCGRRGPFSDNKSKARSIAIQSGWLDRYPQRTDDKTMLFCQPCTNAEQFKANRQR